MPDRLFEDMYRDTERLRWASTAQVQDRGRQLARRRAISVLAAVFVLVAAGGAGAVTALAGSGPSPDRPDVVATAPNTPAPTATPTPPRSPAPTTATPHRTPPTSEPPPSSAKSPSGVSDASADRTGGDRAGEAVVPSAAMLRVSDLPSGYRVDDPEFEGDWHLNFLSALCDKWTSSGLESWAYRDRFFQGGRGGIQERVERYRQTFATGRIPTVRANLQRCPELGVEIADEGFAGAESVLVRSRDGSGWILVRQGDLVAEIAIDDGWDRTEVRRLAERAAARLCAGTNAC